MNYAKNTQVNQAASVAEIESTVSRFGAEAFGYGWAGNAGYVEFAVQSRRVRILVPMPEREAEEFTRTETGKVRAKSAATKAWEQAKRQRWRALALVVKAKLTAVEAGIRTFEEEFGMDFVLDDGRRVFEALRENLLDGHQPLQIMDGGLVS